MYVMPSGEIELYSGIPLKDDYQNTFNFANETAQREYFVSKRVFRLPEQTYTRRQNGYIRVAKNLADLLNVDYLSFLNHGTPVTNPSDPSGPAFVLNNNKRFYCFVINMRYVNEGVTDILFTVDVMQTFLFDLTYKQSYIEREHVDKFIDNTIIRYASFSTTQPILPQGVDVGEYQFYPITFGYNQSNDVFGDFTYVVAATFDKNFNNAVGGLQNGFYSGLAFNVFDNINDINSFLLSAASNNKADGIVSVYMAPKLFAENPSLTEISVTIDRDGWDTAFNAVRAYTPKNKILYCWPFCKIVWTDNNGNTAEYNPQMFSGFEHDDQDNTYYYKFHLTYVCAGSNELSIYPVNYKGVEKNYNEQIVMNLTPQCAYATDSYRAWLAQNSSKMSVERNYAAKAQMLAEEKAAYTYRYTTHLTDLGYYKGVNSDTESLASSFGTTLATKAQKNKIDKTYADLQDSIAAEDYALTKLNTRNDYNRAIGLLNAAAGVASTMPPHANGTASGMAGTVNGAYRLSCYACVPSPGMVRKLDQYFDMYGYRVDRMEVPTRRTRKYWNYIKCALFNADGNKVPDVYFDTIKAVFEMGITFWHDPAHFLDYSQDNHEAYTPWNI